MSRFCNWKDTAKQCVWRWPGSTFQACSQTCIESSCLGKLSKEQQKSALLIKQWMLHWYMQILKGFLVPFIQKHFLNNRFMLISKGALWGGRQKLVPTPASSAVSEIMAPYLVLPHPSAMIYSGLCVLKLNECQCWIFRLATSEVWLKLSHCCPPTTTPCNLNFARNLWEPSSAKFVLQGAILFPTKDSAMNCSTSSISSSFMQHSYNDRDIRSSVPQSNDPLPVVSQ